MSKKPGKLERGGKSWIFSLIAGIIGILGLFTPASYAVISVYGINVLSWYMWMFGFNYYNDVIEGTDLFWTGDHYLLFFQILITIIVFFTNLFVLIKAPKIKDDLINAIIPLIGAIVLIIAMLVYIIVFEIWAWIWVGDSFWGLNSLGFAIIGQFIASGFMFLGFFIANRASKYIAPKRFDLEQERMYHMTKDFIETYFSKSEKSKWLNKLEILQLHYKGTTFLEKKVEFLARKRKESELVDETEYKKALEFFQKAAELSANQPINYSKIDLDLASKIIEEEADKKIALQYLKEIRGHTITMLDEILDYIRHQKAPTNAWKNNIKKVSDLNNM